MKNIKEIVRGNDGTSLEFKSKNSTGEIAYNNGSFNIGNIKEGDYFAVEADGTIVSNGEATAWDEISNSFVGQNIFTVVGRIDYDYEELTLNYTTTARYPEEFSGIVSQTPHSRKSNSEIRPHIHWMQNEDNNPNILVSYRTINNNGIPSSWTLKALTASDNLFPFTQIGQQQITEFNLPTSVGESLGLSGTFEVKIYRDSSNTSGLFTGADTYTGDWEVKYYDIHFIVDMFGSRNEFTK